MYALIWLIIIIMAIAAAGYLLRGKLSGWKTRWFGWVGGFVTGLTAIMQELQVYDWRDLFQGESAVYGPIVGFGVFVVFLVLREITSGPAGRNGRDMGDLR